MGDHKPISEKAKAYTAALEATPENVAVSQELVHNFLDSVSCSMSTFFELDMIVEEIFINIVHYAYGDHGGKAFMDLALNKEGDTLSITFRDTGFPYNPLGKEDPDITAPASERPIGGLGIFLVQKYSNGLSYEYADGQNRLTIHKKLK